MKRTVEVRRTDDEYRRLLLTKRAEMMDGMGTRFDTLAGMGRVAEDDQAQLSHDEFVSLRLNGLDYAQLRMVEEALDRLGSGDYGVCLACDEPIAPKRLHALPWARYCVDCQDTTGRRMDLELGLEPSRVPVAVR